MTEPAGPRADELPQPVRRQLVHLVAAVLPEVPTLPPALRRVAGFAPARRPRLGESAIVAALDADDGLRERVATAVSARSGSDPGDRPAAETAALAWLVRPEGWTDLLADAGGLAVEEAQGPVAERLAAELDRVRQRLGRAEAALREERETHQRELAAAKEEYGTLRKRLGESRSAERAARAELEAERTAEAERIAELESLLAERDKELRALRGRVSELEDAAAGERRTARAERTEGTVRAKLLLDALLEAGAGLRRELGLPAVSGAPGERIEASLAGAEAETRSGLASAGQLEQVLSLPRARLVVDGYNVSKTAWERLPLENQRTRLLQALAPIVARTGAETTVVFDAGASQARPSVSAPRGVKVVFSPYGVIADDVIRDLVDVEPPGRVLVVVTSDHELARDVAKAGARVAAAEVLLGLL